MAVANFSVIRIYTPQRYLHADDEQIKNTVEKNVEVTRNRTVEKLKWWSQRESNPRYRRERPVS